MNKLALINALFSSLGAFVCIGLLAYLNSSIEGSIWLILPFGASIVLVMAVYDSPLARPKNLILGHILSALSGVVIYYFFGNNFISLGLGVSLAIFLMMVTKTIHPPAGANPIIVILTGAGLKFVFLPVAIGSIIIVIFAVMYNRLMKREYPNNG